MVQPPTGYTALVCLFCPWAVSWNYMCYRRVSAGSKDRNITESKTTVHVYMHSVSCNHTLQLIVSHTVYNLHHTITHDDIVSHTVYNLHHMITYDDVVSHTVYNLHHTITHDDIVSHTVYKLYHTTTCITHDHIVSHNHALYTSWITCITHDHCVVLHNHKLYMYTSCITQSHVSHKSTLYHRITHCMQAVSHEHMHHT